VLTAIRGGWAGAERLALVGIVGLAAFLRLWRLGAHGYGHMYYAAGVRSMLTGWRNLLFGAFDPAGFISVDKPPVAFWIQAASARLFGFSGWSLMLPEALGGVAAVIVIYYLVRRAWGPGAGLLAALALAITPISVAVDRVNSTDGLLVVVLVFAAWPLLRAAETGRLLPLSLAMALVGIGFNVKMLAAYLVLPAFGLVYLLTAPVAWRARVGRLVAAGVVLAVVSLSWSVVVDLTPASARPYVGDSQNNTELDLIFGYNGVARLVAGTRWAGRGGWGGRGGAAAMPRVAAPPDAASPATASIGAAPSAPSPGATSTTPPTPGPGPFPGGRGRFAGGTPGPLRLADRSLAGDVTWLFPLAVLGLLAALLERRPLGHPRRRAVLLWGMWLATGAVVFSFAQGMFRAYYVVLLAPPLAALAGLGLTALRERYGEPGRAWTLLPAALVATAAWQAYVLSEYRDWGPVLTAVAVGGGVVAALGLVLARLWRAAAPSAPSPFSARGALAVGLVAVLVSPAAWATTPALSRGASGIAAVGPDLLARSPARGRGGFVFGAPDVGRLVEFLRAHRRGERYLLATATAPLASPVIVETGEPVMAIGGWSGGDPVLTADQFAALVADGQVRFVLLPGAGPRDRGQPPGAGGPAAQLYSGRNAGLFRWVTEHGRLVDPALWRAEPSSEAEGSGPWAFGPGTGAAAGPGAAGPGGGRAWRGGAGRVQQLYDCRPESADAVTTSSASG
jgi:4-amino-4-deoxy-L-arabinose transferase-like glycosyltransferase